MKPAEMAASLSLLTSSPTIINLLPNLLAATSDSEIAALQNAVTATDQQIDTLVYELYGLTEDEIQLVEGSP